MGRDNSIRPTNAELRILEVLWEKGPSTVRQVHERLGGEVGYTTALKLMQIMLEKGILSRNETERTHVYAAAAPAQSVKRNLALDLMHKAFGGSARDLVLQALSAKKASRDELAEIRKMIEEMERKQK